MSKATTKYRLTSKAWTIKDYRQFRDVMDKHSALLQAVDKIHLAGFPVVAKLAMMREFMAMTLIVANDPLVVPEIGSWLRRMASYVERFRDECEVHEWLLLVDRKLAKNVIDFETFEADSAFDKIADWCHEHKLANPGEPQPEALQNARDTMYDGPFRTELAAGLKRAKQMERAEKLEAKKRQRIRKEKGIPGLLAHIASS